MPQRLDERKSRSAVPIYPENADRLWQRENHQVLCKRIALFVRIKDVDVESSDKDNKNATFCMHAEKDLFQFSLPYWRKSLDCTFWGDFFPFFVQA